MRKVSRPYVKNKRLIFGSRKTQRDGFFAAIAPALAPLAREIVVKISGRGKKRGIKRLRRRSRKIILVSKRCR